MRRALTIGGFSLLSMVALAGWVRKPEVAMPQTNFTQSALAPNDLNAPSYAPARAYAQPVVYRTAPRATYVQSQTVVKRPRSTKQSVAIVAGSAGAGAAIGALAGGGKGAGIGALAGGAGGFIYDRMTRNK